MPIDWAQLFAGNSLPVVTRAALIVLLACLFFIHASMSVPGDFCAVVFHVPAHARGHDDNASCNVCWLLSVAVFRVLAAVRLASSARAVHDQSIRETRDEQVHHLAFLSMTHPMGA